MSENANIKALLKKIDPQISLTPDAERMIMMMANEFLADVTEGSCKMASLRGSASVDKMDLAQYLKTAWDITVEGYAINTTNSGVSI